MKKEVNKEELAKLYFKDKKSIREIAKIIGVGKTTIGYYFKKYNLKTRSHNEAVKINPQKYGWIKGLTKESDKRVLNLSLKIKEAYLKKRKNTIKNIEHGFGKSIKKIIKELYWDKGFTQNKIADMLHMDRKLIINFMKELNIKKRPKYQYISSLKGESHSHFGQTWENLYGKEKADKRKKLAAERFRNLTIRRIQNNEFPFFDTKIEILIAKGLLERNILFVKQFKIGNFVCDFAIPNLKIAIECDGDYWHSNPKLYARENLTTTQRKKLIRDQIKNKFLNKKRWIILRFYESEIKSNLPMCLDKIEDSIQRTTKKNQISS